MSKQYLVGGFNPYEKYESQLGLVFAIYGKIKIMFQTTNQSSCLIRMLGVQLELW
jgi:uncharacterized protein YhfF